MAGKFDVYKALYEQFFGVDPMLLPIIAEMENIASSSQPRPKKKRTENPRQIREGAKKLQKHYFDTVPISPEAQLRRRFREEEGRMKSENDEEVVMEGVASIALLPNGSISGHFIQLPQSICYGLFGIELACERECSRGEDYRLIKLTITDFNSKVERDVVVECKGHDAARLSNIDHLHGWEKDVTGLVEEEQKKNKTIISFECETLKAEEAAEEHIKQFMPKLAGMDAVVNVGKMRIVGLNFEGEAENECNHQGT